MNIMQVREYCLSLPNVTERSPFGPDTLCFEIGGKMFCLLDLSGEWNFYNVKVDPDFSIELQDKYFTIRPGYHMNKRHWVSIDFGNQIPVKIERTIIEHAYFQTAKGLSKKMRTSLGFEN